MLRGYRELKLTNCIKLAKHISLADGLREHMPRTSQSLYFGKSCEYRVFSELLKRGYDVYVPLLDNKGIDCVIKKKSEHGYKTIQIKGRQSRWIFNVGTSHPQADYFFLIAPNPNQEVYLVPKKIVTRWLKGNKKFYLGISRRNTEAKQYLQGTITLLNEFTFHA